MTPRSAVNLRTLALLVGICAPVVGAWIDMHTSVAKLQESVVDISRRIERIERSVYSEASNDSKGAQ